MLKEKKGNQRVPEVSWVAEVRLYQMLKKHTVVEGTQHITAANKHTPLKKELTDPEELSRSP